MIKFSPRVLKAFAGAGLATGLRFRAAAADAPAEILVYDQIGYDPWTGEGVTAKDFLAALAQAEGGPVNIRINSPGGDAWDGQAIYNAIRMHKGETTVYVDGVAASAASFIACAGIRTMMGESSTMMIHNASMIAYGDTREMTACAAALAKLDGQIAAIYSTKAGKPVEGFAAMMDAETWMTAAEAVAAGLADEIASPPAREPAAPDNAARERRLRQMRLAASR